MFIKRSFAAFLLTGAMVFSVSAKAADLGGDCCADLEERVADLEATTARKGNKKVSLQIYGHVNQALLIWDDGFENDAYIVDNNHRSTRAGFLGNAKINAEWSAGYNIELQFQSVNSATVSQFRDDGSGDELSLRKSYMYVKSNSLGTLSWGLNSVATDNITHDSFVSGTTDHARPDWEYNRGFSIRQTDGSTFFASGLLCSTALSNSTRCFDIADQRNSIRYDTPTLLGFKLSAAWGEDDFLDVALRYAGEFGDFKVKAGIGYSETYENFSIEEERSWAASAGLFHNPTGLFVQGSYRNTEVDYTFLGDQPDSHSYYVQAGIRQKWNSLGATVLWGEYAHAKDGLFTSPFIINPITSTDFRRWGVGLTQFIDAANMQLYLIYQNTSTDVDLSPGFTALELEDFNNVVIGGTISF